MTTYVLRLAIRRGMRWVSRKSLSEKGKDPAIRTIRLALFYSDPQATEDSPVKVLLDVLKILHDLLSCSIFTSPGCYLGHPGRFLSWPYHIRQFIIKFRKRFFAAGFSSFPALGVCRSLPPSSSSYSSSGCVGPFSNFARPRGSLSPSPFLIKM